MMTGATADTMSAAQWMQTECVDLCTASLKLADGEPKTECCIDAESAVVKNGSG